MHVLSHIARPRRARALAVALATLATALPVAMGAPARAATTPVRSITFPVDGPVSYTDTFGACRGTNCERSHQGQDLMAPKTTPLVATVDGTITWLRSDDSGLSGNALTLTDADGWRYVYIHVNNDTPGTDDGANPAAWRFGPGIEVGATVVRGQLIGWLGDSGNAETTAPHLHFEIRTPDGVAINPYETLQQATRNTVPPRLYVVHTLNPSATVGSRAWARPGAMVLACDIDGDGADEPVQRIGNTFYWRPDTSGSAVVGGLFYGRPTDVPVCGDWDGDGDDTFGVFRNGTWYLRNRMGGSGTDYEVRFGAAEGDRPIVGDWDGDGRDGLGLVRGRTWYVRNRVASSGTTTTFTFGRTTDVALVGDWDGDGVDSAGLRRGNQNLLRNRVSSGSPHIVFTSGKASDTAVVADLDGDDDDALSLWRPPTG